MAIVSILGSLAFSAFECAELDDADCASFTDVVLSIDVGKCKKGDKASSAFLNFDEDDLKVVTVILYDDDMEDIASETFDLDALLKSKRKKRKAPVEEEEEPKKEARFTCTKCQTALVRIENAVCLSCFDCDA